MGSKQKLGRIELRPTAALFIADHEQVLGFKDGRITAAQLMGKIEASKSVSIEVAAAYLHMLRIFDIPQHLGGMNRQKYQFIVSNARATIDVGRPLVLGLDYFVNIANYDDVAHIPDHYKDQKTGFVGHIHYGSTKKSGDFLLGYYFAYKQRYSVVDYYAEDDWTRWGNIDRNRNTNYSGRELRLAYAFGKKMNAVLRFYSVEALEERIENDPAAATETGNRVRLDFNTGF